MIPPYTIHINDEPLPAPPRITLFPAGELIERQTRTPRRPLGAFSDYIVETMPAVVQYGTLTQLHQDIERLLQKIPDRKIRPPGRFTRLFQSAASGTRDLERLDLKMALGACRTLAVRDNMSKDDFLSCPVHKRLMELIRLSEGRKATGPFILTYEDIVLNNPPGDMRVFTTGRNGFMEQQFYRGHQLIEERLKTANDLLSCFINRQAFVLASVVEGSLVLARSQVLPGAQTYLQAVVDLLGQFLSDLPRDDFNGFKPFFNSCPYTGEKGPSGAFSAKVPLTDRLVYGPALPAAEDRYLEANAAYFPAADLKEVFKAASSGSSLLGLCQTDPALQAQARECVTIANLLVAFRTIHLKTVKHQIGAIVTGSAEGQGALRFLEMRVQGFSALRDIMKKSLAPHNP